jgi:hypothetical protein
MRTFLVTLMLAPALAVPAQQSAQPSTPAPPPVGSNWQRVQALAVGQSINVSTRASHAGCKLKSVDADTLTCTHGKDLVFQRTDIVSIKVPHRGRSSLVGLAIGAGVGAIVGRAAAGGGSCNNFCIISPGDVAAGGAIGFGAIGTIVGTLTDFTRSTIYKAP